MDRLLKGEVIVTSKKKKGLSMPIVKAVGLIEAPPAKVWALIDKCADYHKVMPRTKTSKELWRRGNKVGCAVTIEMPFPLKDISIETEAVHTVKPGKLYKREWRGVKGDLKVNKGSWTLKPYDGGKKTIATYKVLSVPKVAIPTAILRAAQQKTLPNLFEALRKATK